MTTTPSGLVARSRLHQLLEEGVGGPVTLVCAPPGSGKSTLVRSWLAARPPSTTSAWVDVFRDETDEAHFWGQVLDAIRDSGVAGADSALATLVPTPHAEPGELVGHLLSGLRDLREQLVLVLDDVQHLRSADLVAELERLLTGAPPTLHIVLLSRRDPKLGLHRLRLAGQLAEIRAADLEFTPEEAGELLEGAGVSVGADEIASLHERTEGWATGLAAGRDVAGPPRGAGPHSSPSSRGASERSPTTCSARCWRGSPPRCGTCCCAPASSSGVNGELADLLTGRTDGDAAAARARGGQRAGGRDGRRRGPGFATTICSLDLLRLELRREPSAARSRSCTGWPHGGTPSAAAPSTRSATRELAADWDAGRASCSASTGCSCCSTARRRRWAPCWTGYRTHSPARTQRSRRSLAAEQLRSGRWAQAEALLASARETHGRHTGSPAGRAETALTTVRALPARQIGGVEDAVDEATAVLDQLRTAGPAGADLEASRAG